jgi:hypothetical protein
VPDLPIYTWSKARRQYRDAKGKFVSREEVRGALDTYLDSVTADIRDIATRLVEGTATIEQFHAYLEIALKEAHTAAGAIAAGGWKQAKADDWATVGRKLKFQYGKLRQFARELENGLPLDGRVVARAEMYGLSATGTYEAVLRRGDIAAGYDQERRLIHSGQSCNRCIAHAAKGWQPAGVLPGIGEDCDCLSNCRCTFERRRSRDRKKAASPAPSPAPPPPPIGPTPPFLEGRPIGERIARWEEGAAKVEALRKLGDDPAFARFRAAKGRLDALERDLDALPEGDRRRDPARKVIRAAAADAHEAWKAQEAAKAAVRERALSLLSVPNPIVLTDAGGTAAAVGPGAAKASEEARAWLSRVAARGREVVGKAGAALDVPVRPTATGRAHATGDAIHLSPGERTSTAVHEMGHFLESHLHGVGSVANQFLAHRVGDEVPTPLRQVDPAAGYREDEFGRRDRFGEAFPGTDAYYVGKVYGGGSTEIMAMGLQKLYEDPAGFARADPEFARFILGILSGHLR